MTKIGNLRGSRSEGRQHSASKSYIRCGILALVVGCFAIFFLFTIAWTANLTARVRTNQSRQIDDELSNHPPARSSRSIASSTNTQYNDGYIMWSKEEAYMDYCTHHYKGNATWGKLHAPYVDKISAKDIVANMHVPNLNVIPTLAILDKDNITEKYTLEFMKSLKQPYIIKATHLSGGVARVQNNQYHCFKYCGNDKIHLLDDTAHSLSLKQLVDDLQADYSKNGNELQYKYITPHVIIEEDIISGQKTNTDVTFWWLSNGHPVFVSEQCELPAAGSKQQGFQMRRLFVGTDHRRLPIVFNRGECERLPQKPASWETQFKIAQAIGKHFPGEVVRLDLYGGGNEVYFSEFTFTTAGCWRTFTPSLTDGLLYGLMKGQLSTEVVTPDYVERVLSDTSWVALMIDDGEESEQLSTNSARGTMYPSPVDLCMQIENSYDGENKRVARAELFDTCIQFARAVQNFGVRCFIVSEMNGAQHVVRSFGVNKEGADHGKDSIRVCAESDGAQAG